MAAFAALEHDVPPPPPPHLSEPAARLWFTITTAKPADYFDAGSEPLLETYCETTAHVNWLAAELNRARSSRMKAATAKEQYFKLAGVKDLERRICQLGATQGKLAAKLKLTVQSTIHRKSGKILERGTGDSLLGGEALYGPSRRGR
jgi:hypothetical protein